MRIVHLSDIHLSSSNYQEFKDTYRDALIRDLLEFNDEKKIDIIVITGDLVDSGGHSLYKIKGYQDKKKYPSPYYIFEEVFITPIIKKLNFPKENFLFIPGNHDIDESAILLKNEYDLTENLDSENIYKHLKENISFRHSKRIKQFKKFEEYFHTGKSNYIFSNNESVFNYNYDNVNVGFILINDSWRCRSQKFDIDKKLMFGYRQFYNGLNTLKQFDTKVNIALIHHPIDNFQEKEAIVRCLNISNIGLYLYGHFHSSDFEKHYEGSVDKCFGIRGRASLNKVNELESSYQPGYQIIDLNFLVSAKITCIRYRQYQYKLNHFDFDSSVCLNGIDEGSSGKGFEISNCLKVSKNLFNKDLFVLK